jgi:hypothetical protein
LFHWIDLKFKGIRFMFIFNLNVVFTMQFLKMAQSRVRFCPGFPPEAGLPGEEFAPACFKNPRGAPLRVTISAGVGPGLL